MFYFISVKIVRSRVIVNIFINECCVAETHHDATIIEYIVCFVVGYSQGVIVNGKTAGVNEFPLMASLIDGQTANLFCGATVIGRHHALTSASCLTGVNPFQIAVLVGDHDMAALGRCASIAVGTHASCGQDTNC